MRIVNKLIGAGLSAFVFCSMTGQAQSDSSTAQLNVTLTIQQGCSIGFDAATPNGQSGAINFGSVINLSEPLKQTATLSIRCSKGQEIPYTISMSAGKNDDGGGYKNRNLKSGSGDHLIKYKICQDASCVQPWGDDSSSVKNGTWTGSQDVQNETVYAEVPAQPNTALFPGVYTDIVVAQIKYGTSK